MGYEPLKGGLLDETYIDEHFLRLLGISKRGDKYLRTLLIHGARAVLMHSKTPPEWLSELTKRRPKNVAVVAMANKMARTIWALTAYERAYQSGYVTRPA